MAKTIDGRDLAIVLEKELSSYFGDVWDDVDKAVMETALDTVEYLKKNSPVDTGKYAKSWCIDNRKRSRKLSSVTVRNKRAMLTHLLEHGHVKVVHGKVLGFTPPANPVGHIKKAEERAVKMLEEKIKEAAK